jgi:hypothetical protein
MRRSKTMTSTDKPFPGDKTAPQRRKDLTDEQIKELELAGGVEGGMEAGSAGPSDRPSERSRKARQTAGAEHSQSG